MIFRMKGFTIVEVLLAMGLFMLVVGGGVGAVVQAFSVNRLGEEESYASFLASEGLEVVRAIATRDYLNLINGSHGLVFEDGVWEFSGSSNSFAKFAREIIVSNVYRDADRNIVTSGGILDLFTRRVESRVTWDFSPQRSNTASATTYFTYWTASICVWDSAVLVGGVDLPGTGDALDIDVADDKAYVVTAKNSEGEFFVLSLSDPLAPLILSNLEISEHVNAVAVAGNYAYLATAGKDEELIVINISNPSSPTEVIRINMPAQANDVFVADDYVYLVTQSATGDGELYVYSISAPADPSLVSSFEVGSHVNGLYVDSERAYLASSKVDEELLVVDVSDPNNPVELGGFDIPLAGANGQSIFFGGGVVHLTTRANDGGIPEYYLLDASDPTNINFIGSYDVSGKTNGVEAGVGFSLLANEKDDEELMIIDTSNPSDPQKVFSLDLGGDATGVALEECYAYFSSADDDQEVKVVTPE